MYSKFLALVAAAALVSMGSTCPAADFPGTGLPAVEKARLDGLAGQPVDIAPWTYAWRADRAVQETPEAYFIPRRLERLDRIYRTASSVLPPDQLKSIYYQMPDILKAFPPKPAGKLLAGLIWAGRVAEFRLELAWPADAEIPPPEALEARIYPTSFGWFGWTVDRVLGAPEISADRHTWTYRNGPPGTMDSAYNVQVEAATEMIAVFADEGKLSAGRKIPVPGLRMVPKASAWKRIDVEIEWGFRPGTETAAFDGHLESYLGRLGTAAPLGGDKGTEMTGPVSWKSKAAGEGRRGIAVPVLYATGVPLALETRVTVRAESSAFSFRVRDLESGPILIPEEGAYVTKAGGKAARQFAADLAARNLASIRQRTREHREPGSFEELMREVRLWTCPDGSALKPFPPVEDPPMKVELPDPGWTAAWRVASSQLRGKHMWGGLAFEVGRVAHEMDLVGLHAEADKVYQYFLKSPGVKSDGDYTDGKGSLEYARDLRHDMGYSHDGTHASTGRLLFAMAERYFLTGDREWLVRHRERLQAAADWILRQRAEYLKEAPNRGDLHAAGLLPPCMLGDYALPCCDWHWYYVDDALSLQAIARLADALAAIDPVAGQKYRDEAEAFRRDIRRTVDREAANWPVRLGRDGMYRSFIPRMAYTQGLTGPEIGAPQFPDCDWFMGSLPLAEPFAALPADDRRMVSTLDLMEEMGTSAKTVAEREEGRKKKGLSTEDAWYWTTFTILPKASHTANIYLLQDDVPSFLRSWMGNYASMVAADGKLFEAWHLGHWADCDAPDNGTAGWFLENFRNLLVMEEGRSLWIARATPRAWLQSGKKISVRSAPTCFGALAYEIVSDADHGKISATIEVPPRDPPERIFVRFRHPAAKPMANATVDGRPWPGIHPEKETVELTGAKGTVTVEAHY